MAPSKLPWFCFYVEDFGDRWHRRLTPAERCLWAAIQGAARQSPVPGVALLPEGVPMTVEDLADFAALKEKEVTVGLAKLEQLGKLYERTDGAWVVVDWDERQPDPEEQREKRAAAGALGNHRRWHAARGATDPECQFCSPNGHGPSPPTPNGRRKPDRNAIALRSHRESEWESGGESLGESLGDSPSDRIASQRDIHTRTDVSQSAVTPTGRAGAGLDDDDDPVLSLLTSAGAILGRRDCDRAIADGVPVSVPVKYRERCIEKRCASADLAALAVANPKLSPLELADLADGPTTSPPRHLASVPPPPPLEPDPNCPYCEGKGQYFVDETGRGTTAECECKFRSAS